MNNIVNPKKPFITKKHMHPRNIYQHKNDFTQMAIDYPEFRKIAKQDINGCISINFKDDETLRILNRTLLKKDFDLDVEIPPGFLVPTISLRLNYILWVEDILNMMNQNAANNTIHGVDIGTGASCVYMLLGAKKNGWHMVGTEIDPESVNYAQLNINNNKLDHLLKVFLCDNNDLLFKHVSEENIDYDFCMCNPPFFTNLDELSTRGRTINRPPPKNIQTGKASELVTDGGENEFIYKMIKESKELKTHIKVYTTMVGHKKHLPALTNYLNESGIKNYCQTEFYQGHTSRWGLAWTFCDDINLETVGTEVIFYDKAKKKSKSVKRAQRPLIYQFTNPIKYPKTEFLLDHFRTLFKQLNLIFTEKDESGNIMFQVIANENNWIHQRQKKRQFMRNYNSSKFKGFEQCTEIEQDILPGKRPAGKSVIFTSSSNKKIKLEDQPQEPLLKFNMVVELINLNQYQLTMMYMGGSQGKDVMHQLLTYLKNRIEE